MRECFIYMLVNKFNNKAYIGVSVNPKNRLKGHKCAKTAIGNALRKYGVENFEMIILATSDEEECYKLEPEYIDLYRTLNTENGYNVHTGGNKPPNLTGRRYSHSEETKAKIRERRKHQVIDEATREKHRQNMLGNKRANGSNQWKLVTTD